MSTESPTDLVHAEHAEHDQHAEHDEHSHGLSDPGYVVVAAALAIMTAMEVAVSYSGFPGYVFMPVLLILMAAKFVTVVSFFMHLKFDNKIFTWLFYSGLLLAVFVYLAALATFHFFDPKLMTRG